MRTARLPAVHDSVATRCQYWCGGVPLVNKFELDSSDGYQMSLAGIPSSEVLCPGS